MRSWSSLPSARFAARLARYLQRVQRFAVVTDQHGGVLAVDRDAGGVLLVGADGGFHFDFKVLDERLDKGDGCFQFCLGGGRLRLLRLRFALRRGGRFLCARLCRARLFSFGSVCARRTCGARFAVCAGCGLCLRLCHRCGRRLCLRLCFGLRLRLRRGRFFLCLDEGDNLGRLCADAEEFALLAGVDQFPLNIVEAAHAEFCFQRFKRLVCRFAGCVDFGNHIVFFYPDAWRPPFSSYFLSDSSFSFGAFLSLSSLTGTFSPFSSGCDVPFAPSFGASGRVS